MDSIIGYPQFNKYSSKTIQIIYQYSSTNTLKFEIRLLKILEIQIFLICLKIMYFECEVSFKVFNFWKAVYLRMAELGRLIHERYSIAVFVLAVITEKKLSTQINFTCWTVYCCLFY